LRTQPNEVYEPREDTWLLLSALERLDLAGKRVLDMGTSSGAIAFACSSMGAEVVAVDLSAAALAQARGDAKGKGLAVEFVRRDLLSAMKGPFDVIAFNPPYLPSPAISDLAVDGGPGGTAPIERFLEDLPPRLSPEGVTLLVPTSLNHPARSSLRSRGSGSIRRGSGRSCSRS